MDLSDRKQVLDHLVSFLRQEGWTAKPYENNWIDVNLGSANTALELVYKNQETRGNPKHSLGVCIAGFGSHKTISYGVWVPGWEKRIATRLQAMKGGPPASP